MSVNTDAELEAFRASYTSVREAIVACHDPIWITQLAFDAVKDKKSIIRAGKWAARSPAGVDEGDGRFLVPLPDPDELLDRWSGESTEEEEGPDGRMANRIRAAMLPFAAFWIVLGIIADGLVLKDVAYRGLVAVGAASIVFAVGYLVMTRWFRWILSYQVARFDADKALAIVMKRLRRARKKYPDHLDSEVRYLRTKCLEVLDREAAFQ